MKINGVASTISPKNRTITSEIFDSITADTIYCNIPILRISCLTTQVLLFLATTRKFLYTEWV
jgi:hypothetical protein